MARQKKAGRPRGRAKPSVLSVRITKHMRELLRQAAWENKRSLSREVEARLDYTLGRYGKGGHDLPPHLKPLVDAFAFTARYIEMRCGCRWHENRLISRELPKAISRVMVEFSPAAEDVIPPKIIENAKRHGAGEEIYLANPGIEDADAIILSIRVARPPEGVLPYLEWEHELWKIRRDLERLEKKRKR